MTNNYNDNFETAFETDDTSKNIADKEAVEHDNANIADKGAVEHNNANIADKGAVEHDNANIADKEQNSNSASKKEEKKRVVQHLINSGGDDSSLESTLNNDELSPLCSMVNNVFEKDFTFKDIADNPALREQMYYVLFSSYGDLNTRIIGLGKTLDEMAQNVQHFTAGLDEAKIATAKEINASKQDFMNFMNSKELQLNTISTTAISVIYNTLSKRIEHQVIAIEAQTKALQDRNNMIEQKIDAAIKNLDNVAEKSLSESVMKTINKSFYKMIGIIVIMQALITIGIYILVKSKN